MLDEATHKGTTTTLPIEHIATLKRTALELELGRGRSIGSADLIRYAVAELVTRIRADPSRAIAGMLAWFERGELEAKREAVAELAPPAEPEAPARATTKGRKKAGRR